jgi:hypothetical protein
MSGQLNKHYNSAIRRTLASFPPIAVQSRVMGTEYSVQSSEYRVESSEYSVMSTGLSTDFHRFSQTKRLMGLKSLNSLIF